MGKHSLNKKKHVAQHASWKPKAFRTPAFVATAIVGASLVGGAAINNDGIALAGQIEPGGDVAIGQISSNFEDGLGSSTVRPEGQNDNFLIQEGSTVFSKNFSKGGIQPCQYMSSCDIYPEMPLIVTEGKGTHKFKVKDRVIFVDRFGGYKNDPVYNSKMEQIGYIEGSNGGRTRIKITDERYTIKDSAGRVSKGTEPVSNNTVDANGSASDNSGAFSGLSSRDTVQYNSSSSNKSEADSSSNKGDSSSANKESSSKDSPLSSRIDGAKDKLSSDSEQGNTFAVGSSRIANGIVHGEFLGSSSAAKPDADNAPAPTVKTNNNGTTTTTDNGANHYIDSVTNNNNGNYDVVPKPGTTVTAPEGLSSFAGSSLPGTGLTQGMQDINNGVLSKEAQNLGLPNSQELLDQLTCHAQGAAFTDGTWNLEAGRGAQGSSAARIAQGCNW